MTDRRLDLPAPSDLPTLVVRSNGSELPRTWAITAATVLHAVDRIPLARLSIRDGAVSERGFLHAASERLAPGRPVELHGGYHGKTTPIFSGIVTRQRIHGGGGRAQLEVVIKHDAVRMTVDRRSAHHGSITDDALCRRLTERSGIGLDIGPSAITHDDLVQYQCTDWDLMLSRARANSWWVIPSMDRLSIVEPMVGQSKLDLTWGATLLDFDLVCDTERQIERQVAATSDGAHMEATRRPGRLGSAVRVDGLVEQARLHHAGDLTDAELGAWAEAVLLDRELTRLRGWVRCQGTAGAGPGDTVTLKDLGDRFDGTAVVTGVCHRFTEGNWTTDFAFGAEPDIDLLDVERASAPPAGGLLPTVPGLQLGRVTALEGDPLGHGRLRVRLPLVDPDAGADGSWARVAVETAGAHRGTVFRPEIDDDVVVGFLEGDPRHPVILGAVHSETRPTPVEASDANDEKAFVSRAGIRWTVDERKPSLTFATPAGRTATLDDGAGQITLEDDAGNSLTLDVDGITLKSAGTITIGAGKGLVLEGEAVTVGAEQTIDIDGPAGVRLTSAGEVSISGALIKLN